jgi:hypothetical protein
MMKAMLYLDQMDQPVSVLDEVKIVEFQSTNHADHSQHRIFYKTKNLNATKTMVDLHRDRRFVVKLEDGRVANALLQHSSIDMQGNAVGVLRVLGDLA